MSNSTSAESPVVEQARAAVAAVRDPELGISLGELGMVKSVEFDAGVVTVVVTLTVPGCPMKYRIRKDVEAAVSGLAGVEQVEVSFDSMGNAERAAIASRLRRPPVARFGDGHTTVICVASGKGGVGKSTVTVNLACALAAAGQRVGVLDADVWGFSVPRMLGASGTPVALGGMLVPLEAHGVKVVSAGFFVEDREPIIWRGPMLHKAMEQFLDDVYWGDLDVLLCDLPPGTGDVSISLAGMLPDARVVVVTTPQDAARSVAERAGRMAQLAQLGIAGVIENMASFVCPCCGEATAIFGEGGGAELADALDAPLLARIPLTLALREAGDNGLPLTVADPDSAAGQAFREAAERLLEMTRPGAPSSVEAQTPIAVDAG